jgi:hypothetical protein
MDERREQALRGGRQTVGIVRVGDTVRRPRHARSDFVHAVLRHLDAAGFDGAPRLLGIDEHGREVLTYINGETIDSSPARLSDARLVSAARLFVASTTPAAAPRSPPHRRSSRTATSAPQHRLQRGHGGRDRRLGRRRRARRPPRRLRARGLVLRRRLRARHPHRRAGPQCTPDVRRLRMGRRASGDRRDRRPLPTCPQRARRPPPPQGRRRLRRDDRLDATPRTHAQDRTLNGARAGGQPASTRA